MRRSPTTRSRATVLGAALTTAVATTALLGGTAHASVIPEHAAAAPAASRAGGFTARVFASGAALHHHTPRGTEALSAPDDITGLHKHLFVGFQNGVGPQGEPSPTGNRDSTIVEFDLHGHALAQWDVVGKCDGLTADPLTGKVLATVNEDAHSAIDVITPGVGTKVVQYRFSRALPSRGGTDALSIYHGMILISASAPGTTGAPAPRASYPAVYKAQLNHRTHQVTIQGLFSDTARATVANTTSPARGRTRRLGLADPDSNEVVPAYATRFAGDFMLTSQGDKDQIFATRAGQRGDKLTVLHLSDAVDDTAWAADRTGTLYATNASTDAVDRVTGPFRRGQILVADTPCDAAGAPATCPAPGFTANYLGQLNPRTGAITRVGVTGAPLAPKGMLFLP